MYKLTEKRRRAAEPIFEKYQRQLGATGQIASSSFEKELRDCWDTGYQELKDIIIALSKIPAYERLAAYYMEYGNVPAPVTEFQPRLAELYGVTYYHSKATTEHREAYWSKS